MHISEKINESMYQIPKKDSPHPLMVARSLSLLHACTTYMYVSTYTYYFDALELFAENLFLREAFSIAELVPVCFFIVNAETVK